MKKRIKSMIMIGLTAALVSANIGSSMAAESTESIYKTLDPNGKIRYLKWMKDDKGYWYQYTDDGSYPKGQWIWISPVKYYKTCLNNGDAECVYIKDDGYIFNSDACVATIAGVPHEEVLKLQSMYSPDGYPISVSGQWVTREGFCNEEIVVRHFKELETH